ncbi:hypothetical protein PGB90_004269 [Kerria lacca]
MSNKPSVADAINHLFERPGEPSFRRKGAEGNFQFVLPQSYYTDKYTNIKDEPTSRIPPDVYEIKEVSNIPDLLIPKSLSNKEMFSVFNEYHRSCAMKLVDIFLDAKNLDEFVSLAAYCKNVVNPYLYHYAFSIALLHRSDSKNIEVPSHCLSFPQLYFDRAIFARAREEENIIPKGSRDAIEIPRDYTASNLELEHRVAYFREDVGVNLHHWHWHLVYPLQGRDNIVRKDRRGELFYYMHQQIVARYNLERLCNNLARVKRLVDLREPIEEGYYPKLDNPIANRPWPSRHSNSRLSNLNREVDHVLVDIQDLERWRDRIFEAIHTGRYLVDGENKTEAFQIENGIDILGNMIESNVLSVNRTEYGNLHNHGHNLISYVHDPENNFGVMGDSATAMRDPAFYRWHAYINYMFEQYKHRLPPYTVQQLSFDGIQVTKIQVKTTGKPDNEISTFWQQADIDLSRGLDFADKEGIVYARVTHLQHAPFEYNITVNNEGNARMGTIRIFYAPKYDERGYPYFFTNQKGLFIELDRFTYNLNRGTNVIVRKSIQSSVTIPYEQTFRNLMNKPKGSAQEAAFTFCGCGWPQHMLVAKGNTSGFPCELFVMVTNYDKDKVTGTNSDKNCDDASSYCGIRDSKYPDKQPMGFPFDRLPRENVQTLQQFLTKNMNVLEIRIRFSEDIKASIQKKAT